MNISLIGMMGSGKTTIGELLAKELGFVFTDTDSEIVNKENRSINEIFETDGEDYFRRIETQVLEDVLKKRNQIISTGGGIIKSDKNIKLLRELSIIFYLEADENTLFTRVKNNKERPLLNVDNMKDKIHKLLIEREYKYKQAHHTISTINKEPINITNEIIGIINEYYRS